MTTKVTTDLINTLDASKLTGTIADARFPATLPAVSGANLTGVGVTGITSSANTTAITISADEQVNMPLQPCFQVQAVAQTDQTGDGTTHTANLANEIFDIGGNFASKTFTAPITGKYILCLSLQWAAGQYGTTDLATINLVTSNRTYYTNTESPNDIHTQHTMSITRIADMDASDTASVTWRIAGGSKTADHVADASTSLSGCLIA